MRQVSFTALPVSFTDLISTWVETFHEEDYVIVVLDPVNHLDALKVLNLGHDSLKTLYRSKVLALSFSDLDEAKLVLDKFKKVDGPYFQMYFF